MLSPEETIKIAKKYGLKMPRQKITGDLKEAKKFAEKIGYPVVLKISSSSHKTESGGVFTEVRKDNFSIVFRKLKKKSDLIMVQKQIKGIETMIGGIKDSQFGHCVSFGAGGVLVEAMGDINFRVCPVGKKDAMDMVKESVSYKVLKGYRGRRYDIKSIVNAIKGVSDIVSKEGLNELDINPLICNEKGAWAVDVRMG